MGICFDELWENPEFLKTIKELKNNPQKVREMAGGDPAEYQRLNYWINTFS